MQGNCISRSANAGCMCWHTLDTRVIGNSIFDCNRLSYAGIGALGDAFGNLVFDGADEIQSGTYIGTVSGNSIMKCNQGRAAGIYGITLGEYLTAYPTASNKIALDGNFTDAASKVYNWNSIPVVSFTESGDTSELVVENTDDNASIEIKTQTTAAHSSSLSWIVDSSNNLADRSYRLFADNSFQLQTFYNNAWLTSLRLFPSGEINIGTPAPTGTSLGKFRCKNTFYYDDTGVFNSAVTMNSDLLLEGVNVKDKLDTISAPTKIFDNNSSSNISGTPRVLPNDDDIVVVAGGDSGYGVLNTYSYRLPAHSDGRHVRFYNYGARVEIRQADESAGAGDNDFIFYWSGSAWSNSALLGVYNDSTHDSNVIDCHCIKHPTHATFHYWAFSKNVTTYSP